MKSFVYNIGAFRSTMVKTMGFSEYTRQPSGEVCWRFTIPRTLFTIHVRSGLTADNSFTPAPDLGIRIYVLNTVSELPVMEMVRVRRTDNALRNVRGTVGRLYKYVLSHKDRTGRILIHKD